MGEAKTVLPVTMLAKQGRESSCVLDLTHSRRLNNWRVVTRNVPVLGPKPTKAPAAQAFAMKPAMLEVAALEISLAATVLRALKFRYVAAAYGQCKDEASEYSGFECHGNALSQKAS